MCSRDAEESEIQQVVKAAQYKEQQQIASEIDPPLSFYRDATWLLISSGTGRLLERFLDIAILF